MIIAVNIGNTRTNAGVLNDEGAFISNLSCNTTRTPDGYRAFASSLPVDARVLCSSVVPEATLAFARAIRLYGFCLEVVTARDDLGLKFNGLNYAELGADLFTNALASHFFWSRSVLNVDLGTGSTFCVIREGVYLGTSIVPGMELSLRALTSSAALIRPIELAKPSRVINTTTVECVQSGIYYGYLELVRGMIYRVQKEQGRLFVVLTGGIGSFLREELHDVIDIYEPNLTLYGLWVASQKIPQFPLV
ncbi:MAG: type III pantothenate kinase [Bacillota bacterium]|nr:MAG: type III pantothenate kinase [Bacillota bacterium]